jgi:hypothetical protein
MIVDERRRRIPSIYRYAYPDDPHHAEAMRLAADHDPIFVTNNPSWGSGDLALPRPSK